MCPSKLAQVAVIVIACFALGGSFGLACRHKGDSPQAHLELSMQVIEARLAAGDISEVDVPHLVEIARIEATASWLYGHYGADAEEDYLLSQGLSPVSDTKVENELESPPPVLRGSHLVHDGVPN